MKNILFLILIVLLNSCHVFNSKKSPGQTKQELFNAFLKKFKKVELPYIFQQTKYYPIKELLKDTQLCKLDTNTFDTLFINTGKLKLNEYYCYGLIKDSPDYYILIYYVSDCCGGFLPIFATYSSYGNLIDENSLYASGNMSDGPCSGSTNGILFKDHSIQCSDTFYCPYIEGRIPPSPKSGELILSSKTGHITRTGKIIMSDLKYIKKDK